MSDHKGILNRSMGIAIPFFLLAIGVIAKLLSIQYWEGAELRARADREVIREVPIPAERGNIFSEDGKLLATTMPIYDIYFDPLTVEFETFANELPALAEKLAQEVGKRRASQWKQYLQEARNKGQRYLLITKGLTYREMREYREFPIFREGRFSGGMIAEQRNKRKMPLGKIAERTIGHQRPYYSTGLEGAFNGVLRGQDGRQLKQKVSQGNWKPMTDQYEVTPENGKDLTSTLDTRIQDVTHHELLRALERFEADHGTAVVMDVKTGAIRAMANLGRTSQGHYFEKRNYAIWESTEPGSTFKLASVLALLDDGHVDTNTMVQTGKGYLDIYGARIYDSNHEGYGSISLSKAFAVSSNVGIVKLMQEHYSDNPDQFVDRLYTIGLHNKLDLPIRGEGNPVIPTPGGEQWSGLSLPWMAFGYQVSFTPLQLLSFYNAIANDGMMVKPRLVEQLQQHGQPIQRFEPEVLHPQICSQATCRKLQKLLRKVVTEGTAQNIQSSKLALAGKTGTCELNYWKGETNQYQASFAGYFPADDPQYSCIVVINSPNYHRGYYGSAVAAPVFRAIAEQVHVAQPQAVKRIADEAENTFGLRPSIPEVRAGEPLPDLQGLPGATLLSRLENRGFKVRIEGNGQVQWQYPKPGTKITQDQLIELKLG